MAVYIIGDAKFLESAERDDQIIERWNEVITNDDLVLLMGEKVAYFDFDKGEDYMAKEIRAIFSRLNGRKKVIDVQSDSREAETWSAITERKTFLVNGAIPGNIDGKDEVILLLCSMYGITKGKDHPYCATAKSISQQKEIYEDKILSISWDDWGGPVNYMDVGRMIDDQVLLEKMEDNNA